MTLLVVKYLNITQIMSPRDAEKQLLRKSPFNSLENVIKSRN